MAFSTRGMLSPKTAESAGDVEAEVAATRKQPKASLKAAEEQNGLFEAKEKVNVKGTLKRRKHRKEALKERQGMSQFLDTYTPPPSNSVILNS